MPSVFKHYKESILNLLQKFHLKELLAEITGVAFGG